MVLRVGMTAGAALLITSAAAMAGPTDAEKCESGKLKETAKYASCRLKAESKAVRKGEAADYTKCNDKFGDKFPKNETKAGVGVCPTEGDQTTVSDYLDDCTSRASLWLAGGGGLPDACEGDLATCENDLAACLATSGGPLPKTGQTTAYGAGSDGDLEWGAARSFTDNGDGTITDHATGLMWEKKSDDGSIHDKDNVYTWSTSTYDMDGTMVTTFLAALNGGGGFAGYTDWRIPNVHEMASLVNFEIAYPGPTVFPEFDSGCTSGCAVMSCSCTQPSYHWSSTTSRTSDTAAWIVYFDHGYNNVGLKTNPNLVRAVRAGS